MRVSISKKNKKFFQKTLDNKGNISYIASAMRDKTKQKGNETMKKQEKIQIAQKIKAQIESKLSDYSAEIRMGLDDDVAVYVPNLFESFDAGIVKKATQLAKEIIDELNIEAAIFFAEDLEEMTINL